MICQLAKKVRRFFPPDAAAEIWAELKPRIQSIDTMDCFEGLGMLNLLMPCMRVAGRCRLTLSKPRLKRLGAKRLKLKCVELLSILLQFCFNFAFKFNMRRYSMAPDDAAPATTAPWAEWQGLTLVHFSAQPQPFLTQNSP